MRIEECCKIYLSGFQELSNFGTRSNKEIARASAKVFTCLLLLPLTIIVAATYGICRCFSSTPPDRRATSATHSVASEILDASKKKESNKSEDSPAVSNQRRRGKEPIDIEQALTHMQTHLDLSTQIYQRKRTIWMHDWYTREQLMKFADEHGNELTKEDLENRISMTIRDVAQILLTAINKQLTELPSHENIIRAGCDPRTSFGIPLYRFRYLLSPNDSKNSLLTEMIGCLAKLDYGFKIAGHNTQYIDETGELFDSFQIEIEP